MAILSLGIQNINAQNMSIQETVTYINNLLKENPYFDNYMKVYEYYSIDVNSNYDFIIHYRSSLNTRTDYRMKVSDLSYTYKNDYCSRNTEMIAWGCKTQDYANPTRCVMAESYNNDGSKETHYFVNMSISFSNKNEICDKIYNSLDYLFKKILEASPKNNDSDPFSKGNYKKW